MVALARVADHQGIALNVYGSELLPGLWSRSSMSGSELELKLIISDPFKYSAEVLAPMY